MVHWSRSAISSTNSWIFGVTRDLDFSALMDAQLVDRLTTIVSRAAAVILTFNPATAPRRTKVDRSPVSAADEAANAIILEGLSPLLPNMPIVSEETTCANCNPAAFAGCFALVDPLDGTREFLAGRNEFTVNVALVIGGTPVVGIIAAPALALVWRGVAGRGAERICLSPGADASQATQRTSIRTRRRPDGGLGAVISRSHFDAQTAALLSALPIGAQMSCGSSFKFYRNRRGARGHLSATIADSRMGCRRWSRDRHGRWWRDDNTRWRPVGLWARP